MPSLPAPQAPLPPPSEPPAFTPLATELLAAGQPIVFRADGISMRPALKPGDSIRVEPLGERPPRAGQVVLFRDATGRLRAHRVMARRRLGGTWHFVPAGDGHHGSLDAPVALDQVLGTVTAYQRGGQEFPLRPLAPGLEGRLRALWTLAVATGRAPFPRLTVPLGKAVRRLGLRALGLVPRLRALPAVGPLARLVWPDMASRCTVEVTAAPHRPEGRLFLLDAVIRGRSAARLGLHRGFAIPRHADEWWISGVHTAPLYRRRGLAGVLVRQALQTAWEQGAPEVLAAIAETNRASLTLFARAGFRPLADQSFGDELNAHFRTLDPASPRMVIVSRRAGE
jgi:GNAT superfamily N-acetyltransferase